MGTPGFNIEDLIGSLDEDLAARPEPEQATAGRRNGDRAADPVLVIDFGTSTSSAVLVVGGTVRQVDEPTTGSWSWPSAVAVTEGAVLVGTLADQVKRDDPAAYRAECKRDLGAAEPVVLGAATYRPQELVAEVLRALKLRAEQLHGGPVERALLTVPASYRQGERRWQRMLEAGELAGFVEVELMSEPVAAAVAPVLGTPFVGGDLVLVYDLGGGTFDTAVVRIGRRREASEVLGHDALDDVGGRDVDALLARHAVQLGGADLLEQLRPADGDPESALDAQLAQADLEDFVRGTKFQLSELGSARLRLRPARRRIEVARAELAELVAPLLERTITCCRELLAELELGPGDLTGVVLVGGSCRMPMVADAVEAAFGRPPRRSDDLALAVVVGAAEWVRNRGPREAAPSGPTADRKPLCWDFSGGSATLVRLLVDRGEPVVAAAAVAVVRTADGTLLRLLNGPEAAAVRAWHAAVGDTVPSGVWLLTVGPPSDSAQ